MSRQLCLAFGNTMAERFEQFHSNNPIVYRTLVRLVREWVNRTGRRKLGIKTLYERARWEIALETGDPECRLNNNFTAFYARLIMANNPDLDGIFDLRASAADEWMETVGRARAS